MNETTLPGQLSISYNWDALQAAVCYLLVSFINIIRLNYLCIWICHINISDSLFQFLSSLVTNGKAMHCVLMILVKFSHHFCICIYYCCFWCCGWMAFSDIIDDANITIACYCKLSLELSFGKWCRHIWNKQAHATGTIIFMLFNSCLV